MKRQAFRSAAIMAMAALPVLVLGLIALPAPRQMYWASVYVVWGTLLAALCFAATARTIRRAERSHSPVTKMNLALGGMTAWGLSFPVLVLTTLTPLCLGQNNGDGRNNVGMCLFLAVVWFIFMSAPVCGGLLLLAKWASNTPTDNPSQTEKADAKQDCQPSPPPLPRAPRTGHSEGEGWRWPGGMK
jgi:hypothetical protein